MGKIVKVSGPLVVATGMEEANMADVVRVGEQRLIGEILNMSNGAASIQVYEETAGLGDQLLTDTLAAHRLGLISIIVPPIKDKTTLFFKSKRLIEKPFIKRYKNLHQKSEDKS